jgi:hypothetical protein
VSYGDRRVDYRTFGAAATEVLRLNFKPSRITAGGTPLAERSDLTAEGFTVKALPGGDWVVRIRHLNSGEVRIGG